MKHIKLLAGDLEFNLQIERLSILELEMSAEQGASQKLVDNQSKVAL